MKIPISENSVKSACESYLEIQQSLGKLIWLRLNSGSLILDNGNGTKRRVKCCPPGTSDNLIILPRSNPAKGRQTSPNQNLGALVIFCEYKGVGKSGQPKKQSPEQVSFERMVESQGHLYWLVSDAEAFIAALNELEK